MIMVVLFSVKSNWNASKHTRMVHEIRVNRIAAMTSARIIKVDDIELGLDLIN